MEFVAMEMKRHGMYIARELSYKGATFKVETVELTPQSTESYNDSVKLWVLLREKFSEAVKLVNADPKMRKTMWAQFWSAHQRFFKYLCIASKVSRVVELTKEAIKRGQCVVIGLQSTGEASAKEQIENDGELSDFISTVKGVVQSFVEKHFPALDAVTDEDIKTKLVGIKDHLIHQMELIDHQFPPNTLDQLTNELGGPDYVAEMTGRKKRLVKSADGQVIFF